MPALVFIGKDIIYIKECAELFVDAVFAPRLRVGSSEKFLVVFPKSRYLPPPNR